MYPIRKTILDKFQEYLLSAYSLYCQQHQLKEDAESLLVFLIDRDLIPPAQIKRYAVGSAYHKLATKGKKKTAIIKEIADFMNISERHTWSLIKYEAEKRNK